MAIIWCALNEADGTHEFGRSFGVVVDSLGMFPGTTTFAGSPGSRKEVFLVLIWTLPVMILPWVSSLAYPAGAGTRVLRNLGGDVLMNNPLTPSLLGILKVVVSQLVEVFPTGGTEG